MSDQATKPTNEPDSYFDEDLDTNLEDLDLTFLDEDDTKEKSE